MGTACGEKKGQSVSIAHAKASRNGRSFHDAATPSRATTRSCDGQMKTRRPDEPTSATRSAGCFVEKHALLQNSGRRGGSSTSSTSISTAPGFRAWTFRQSPPPKIGFTADGRVIAAKCPASMPPALSPRSKAAIARPSFPNSSTLNSAPVERKKRPFPSERHFGLLSPSGDITARCRKPSSDSPRAASFRCINSASTSQHAGP